MQADLIAQWDFASSGNLLVDSSGNGHTLVKSASTAWSSDMPSGSGLSGSVLFDGSTSTMETVADLDLTGYKDITATWWQKFTGTGSGVVFEHSWNVGTVIGGFSSVVNNNNVSGQGQLTWKTTTSKYAIDRYTNEDESGNTTWEQVTATFDLEAASLATVVQVWDDGVLGTTLLQSNPPASFVNDVFTIGYQQATGIPRYYAGNIAGLKIEGTPTVPEPGSLILLATGLLGLVACSRRKRK